LLINPSRLVNQAIKAQFCSANNEKKKKVAPLTLNIWLYSTLIPIDNKTPNTTGVNQTNRATGELDTFKKA
jgi:hypothetical protein